MNQLWMWLGVGLGGLLGIALLTEIGLRVFLGLGQPLLYVADPQIGYLLAPNQSTRRFGNRIQINQFSMRNAPIALTPLVPTKRVLLIGDSIANGGWWTDQSATISALLQQQLQSLRANAQVAASQKSVAPSPAIEVLNASANSWGPRNELAYLQRYGTFHSQAIVLLINTDDLFAVAPYSVVVGRAKNYPDRQPPFALAEAVTRYLTKEPAIPELKEIYGEKGDRVGRNLEAIRQIQAIALETDATFILMISPLLREVEQGPKDYEIEARQRLTEFAQQQQIPFIDLLPIFSALPQPRSLYQDHIHLNHQGNQEVVQHIIEKL